MQIQMMKCKIHRATVTEADLNYEGSITIDKKLCAKVGLLENERVEIYNCNNGMRFATYVIYGKKGEICVNGAAARMVHKGDIVIIVSYCSMSSEEAKKHKPNVILVDSKNQPKRKAI